MSINSKQGVIWSLLRYDCLIDGLLWSNVQNTKTIISNKHFTSRKNIKNKTNYLTDAVGWLSIINAHFR